jgi:hypothetical protein
MIFDPEETILSDLNRKKYTCFNRNAMMHLIIYFTTI